eukprot:CAMPEP_0114580210 /NCGR_PEP_ID=MMETSP0125-20121206/4542_1 /TAXON_ID=485358 ORGANISM="Aristerostoma sp., Strain ATCC 50986" /NCGR_SAMPLE_ID=MMETSP0125 /ASSEMBLY_ACC=CAM_ASM_000245 /LENGTH=133 /DNA_ID=CAMNT_0001771637 /DNA_START=951 /DNA_END=1352 /DNA_ORIENTATION=+
MGVPKSLCLIVKLIKQISQEWSPLIIIVLPKWHGAISLHSKENDSEREDITSVEVAPKLAINDLWSSAMGSSSSLNELVPFDHRLIKVDYPDVVVESDHDIVKFKVKMDDIILMKIFNAIYDLMKVSSDDLFG